jgi:hypothetical protein
MGSEAVSTPAGVVAPALSRRPPSITVGMLLAVAGLRALWSVLVG